MNSLDLLTSLPEPFFSALDMLNLVLQRCSFHGITLTSCSLIMTNCFNFHLQALLTHVPHTAFTFKVFIPRSNPYLGFYCYQIAYHHVIKYLNIKLCLFLMAFLVPDCRFLETIPRKMSLKIVSIFLFAIPNVICKGDYFCSAMIYLVYHKNGTHGSRKKTITFP